METDWIMGLVGGLMIGLAASLYLLGNGRIMGASGIIGGLVDKSEWSSAADRIVFLIGLMLAPSIFIFIFSHFFTLMLIYPIFFLYSFNLLKIFYSFNIIFL